MFTNYLKIAWRSLLKNRSSSIINIGGLAVDMAVAMLIGLRIWDEVSFDHRHTHHSRIVQVMDTQIDNGRANTSGQVAIPLRNELETKYGSDFKQLVLSTQSNRLLLAAGEKKINEDGLMVQPDFPSLFSLKMLAGVYDDLPANTTLADTKFLASWDKFIQVAQQAQNEWGNHSFLLFARLTDQADLARLNALIENIPDQHIPGSKEIGIRKVLGASVFSIWRSLSREFVLLVACAIAGPLSYSFMHGWLQQYTYRTPIHWWLFAVSIVGALLIALATVSIQAVRAALDNPVKALRSE